MGSYPSPRGGRITYIRVSFFNSMYGSISFTEVPIPDLRSILFHTMDTKETLISLRVPAAYVWYVLNFLSLTIP